MADSIPNTKVVAYTERGWANNHDVLTLNRSDRLKPWDKPFINQAYINVD